ncbi:three component ABC system middle component [Streptomyces hygroscopicus]|uniref:three component ABC system middle component n=1 Tax=Streptomyces hygroscopicus TaxID=1912 RepID=UPI0007676757|nr:three component ABC system middle component [Streptomyces hygroscopicus]
MSEFSTLSRDERAIYNPAFTGLVVARAVQGHQTEFATPCPVVIATLAAVMALQPTVRTALPRSTASGLHRWVQGHPDVRASMTLNATAIADVVRPGLLMALQTRTLTCDAEGHLHVPSKALKKAITGGSDDVTAVQKAALLLGRWLPSAGSISTVMTLLGVRP